MNVFTYNLKFSNLFQLNKIATIKETNKIFGNKAG